MNSKVIRVKYSPEFDEKLSELKKFIKDREIKLYKQLLKAIERETENLRLNPNRGIQIPKDRIPQEYIIKYGVTNLWKINLPDYWRMIYTIVGNEFEIISILLGFMNHKEYNKIFSYRNK